MDRRVAGMGRIPGWCLAALVLVALVGCTAPRTAIPEGADGAVVRAAAYNIQELSRVKVDSVDALGHGAHPQLRAAAEVIQRIRPGILVLNEVDLAREGYGLDHDDLGAVVRDFQSRYLAVGGDSIRYPHLFIAPSNTGILTGLDLNRDGTVATPAMVDTRAHGDDSFGFGEYPGQYAMAVLSMHPIDSAAARTFRMFLWKDFPGHHMPTGFYGDSATAIMRLSSKSHWDVPVRIDGRRLHLLVSHPTPPVFDGPEDRNGRRNFDEVGFWARYLGDGEALYDDRGRRGGYGSEEPFLVMGDLNADPVGGDAQLGDTTAISQLLGHPRIQDPAPLRGRPTAEFLNGVRVDYVLPSAGLEVLDGGVFWPAEEEDAEARALADLASDHRLVWLDIRFGGS